MREYFKGLNRAAEKHDSLMPEDIFPDEEESDEAEREHREEEARENARERAWEEY